MELCMVLDDVFVVNNCPDNTNTPGCHMGFNGNQNISVSELCILDIRQTVQWHIAVAVFVTDTAAK